MNGSAMLKAALASAIAIFGFGFLFGTLRIFLLIPRLGALGAVSVELPFMLVASALVWHWTLGYFRVPADGAKRLITGLGAFAVLMGLEYVLSWVISEAGPQRFLADIVNPAGLLGLAGQFAFALMPLVLRTRQDGA